MFWPILYEVKSYFQIFGRIWWFKEFLKCLFFEKFTSVLTHFVWRKILVLRFLNFWAKLTILSIFRNFQFLKNLQVFWPILYEKTMSDIRNLTSEKSFSYVWWKNYLWLVINSYVWWKIFLWLVINFYVWGKTYLWLVINYFSLRRGKTVSDVRIYD